MGFSKRLSKSFSEGAIKYKIDAARLILQYAVKQEQPVQAVLIQNGATPEQLEEARENLMRKLMVAVDGEAGLNA